MITFSAIVAGLVVALTSAIVGIILAVIGAAGVGLVTYTGIEILLGTFRVAIITQVSGIPSDILNMMGLLGVDVAIKIIFSAITAGFTAGGIFNGISFIGRTFR